jgi:hypothetical protein
MYAEHREILSKIYTESGIFSAPVPDGGKREDAMGPESVCVFCDIRQIFYRA